MERIKNTANDNMIKQKKVKDSLRTGRKCWNSREVFIRFWSGKMI
jgi:hypothetical protein